MEKGEVNITDIVKTLWEGRKIIIKVVFIFLILGLCIAFLSEKEYTSSVTIVPHTNDAKSLGGNIGSIAAIAGINLGSNGETVITPALYPKIVKSIPFQLELLKTKLSIEKFDEKISYSNYYFDVYKPSLLGYLKKYTIELPGLIISAFKDKKESNNNILDSNGFFTISLENKLILKRLDKQLNISVNEKEGFVIITAIMPEALASAELVSNAQKILQDYIIKFKVKKSNEQLKFVKERYDEKEKEFRIIQNELASFLDQNRNVSSALAKTKLNQLQSSHDLAYNVFVELAKQYETQQIQVKEDTPIFTILDPVSIPFERSFPKRGVTLIIFIVLGIIVGFLVVGLKSLKQFLIENITKK